MSVFPRVVPSIGAIPKHLCANAFVRRQTAESSFTHFLGSFEELLVMAARQWDSRTPGYKPGVVIVKVPGMFRVPIVRMVAGKSYRVDYEARREGEYPRMHISAPGGDKLIAEAAELVFYSRELLSAAGDETPGSEAEYELISVNGLYDGEPTPLHFITLIENQLSGSTSVEPEKFEKLMAQSYQFWRDKAFMK